MTKTQKRIIQSAKLIRAFADSVNEVIYHYTSAEGLRGIIENNEIWLTNVEFVNDKTECKALQKEKFLFRDKDFSNPFVKDSWNNLINHPYNDYDTYIASFTRGKETLEQWRAYGNFRIGFDAKKLINSRFNLYECIYSKDEIKNWLLKKQRLGEWNGKNLDDTDKEMAAFQLIYAASKKYKNSYFKNENEVRLISISHHTWEPFPNSPTMFISDSPIHYRDHQIYKVPVPYVKFVIYDNNHLGEPLIFKGASEQLKQKKLDDEKTKKRCLLPIVEILIGPMLHQEEARISCEILLNDKSYKDVKVNLSEIPYRGF